MTFAERCALSLALGAIAAKNWPLGFIAFAIGVLTAIAIPNHPAE